MPDGLLTGGDPKPTADPGGDPKPDPGEELKPWAEQLSKEQKADENVRKFVGGFETLPELVTSHMELAESHSKMVGIPGEDATPEQKVAFLKALGVPDNIDAYKLVDPEKIPDGMTKSEAMEKALKEGALKAGVTPAQLQIIADGVNSVAITEFKDGREASQVNRRDGENALREKWRGDYPTNLDKANKAMNELASPEYIEKMKQLGLANDPVLIDTWYQIYEKALGEDTLLTGKPGAGTLEKAPATFEYKESM